MHVFAIERRVCIRSALSLIEKPVPTVHVRVLVCEEPCLEMPRTTNS